jgi:hypothetical protein
MGALRERVEHGWADVHGVDADGRVLAEELGGEAAVSIAEDEGAFVV